MDLAVTRFGIIVTKYSINFGDANEFCYVGCVHQEGFLISVLLVEACRLQLIERLAELLKDSVE